VASVTDLDPEFTVAVHAGSTGTIALDNSRAPVRIGDTGSTFRFWYTGTFVAGTLDISFIAGSYNTLDAASEPVANAAGSQSVTVAAGASNTWIDVRFTTAGGVAIDAALLADAAREFALSGAGLGGTSGVKLVTGAGGATLAPMLISSSTDGIDNDGNGIVDEDGETVYRYFLTRGFVVGSVTSPSRAPTGPTRTAIRARTRPTASRSSPR
jgi:hypothetical protein